jgi:hypothetical protein
MLFPIGAELLLDCWPFHSVPRFRVRDFIRPTHPETGGRHWLDGSYSLPVGTVQFQSSAENLMAHINCWLAANFQHEFLTLTHPESSCLFHRFPCKSDLTFLKLVALGFVRLED